MTTAEHPLLTLLNQQQAQLNALLLLLQQELNVLSSRDIDVLDELTQQKAQLLSQITDIDVAISQQPDLENHVKMDWFTSQVIALDSLLDACKSQTQVNQHVLEHSQLTLDRLKNELLASKGKSGLTYTNKGKPAVDNKGSGVKA
ncbi:flagellar export chaperone FlgN [Alishewanella tabrizica]|uniref:Flagellar biosynthesis protein FlgN n=1 Tax=Alishewanella tabrizica TaxID=671278 RepID=A0ABQ2WQJ1_9ALTE|nr:flagellar export chaperone FlgN [Alishewanella tabrizica]GGW63616.1 hypothetical protein GCM10008111_19610 [Alishewanella tabrizica]